MEVNEPGDIRLAYSPLNLISAAYADLAALVATKAEVKECSGYGRAFLPGSGKHKYHTTRNVLPDRDSVDGNRAGL